MLEQIRVITEIHGRDTYERALSTLPPTSQAEIAALINLSWIDTTVAMELKNAIARELGRNELEFQRWVVRTAIQHTLSRFWGALLSLASDVAVIKRSPILYRKTFDRGELALVERTTGSALFEVRGWPSMPEYDAIGLASGMEAVLEHLHRRDARVRVTRQGSVVQLAASWRPK